jgi:2-pyrone-4,6-dicarboxylate lactonase
VLMDLFRRCVPDEAVRRKILIDDPARLYGL